MNSLPRIAAAALIALLAMPSRAAAADTPLAAQHYYDEAGARHLTLQPVNGGQTEVRVRWASPPGSAGQWLGLGNRKDGQLLFAAVVEEGQDRGTCFVAKGEAKLEVAFRPNQKMPQDPGIVGIYRHISHEKHAQLLRKEAQAAEDRLAAALKTAARAWAADDRPAVADWKTRWPALREQWMKIAWQPAVSPQPKTGGGAAPSLTAKDRSQGEADPDYWLKQAEVCALGCAFIEPLPDPKSRGGWDGEYSDGFGGSVSIRKAADGRLRVSLSCTRVNEMQGADLQGVVPAEAVKPGKGAEPATAAATFAEAGLPENAQEVQVTFQRQGGFLWVATRRQQQPPGRLAWFDGIYRWAPVPVEP